MKSGVKGYPVRASHAFIAVVSDGRNSLQDRDHRRPSRRDQPGPAASSRIVELYSGPATLYACLGIPRRIERAFSKRRQAIEEAARVHGYNTPRGMELATLRTRRPKRDAKLGELINHWQAEAKALGFELGRTGEHMP